MASGVSPKVPSRRPSSVQRQGQWEAQSWWSWAGELETLNWPRWEKRESRRFWMRHEPCFYLWRPQGQYPTWQSSATSAPGPEKMQAMLWSDGRELLLAYLTSWRSF